MSKHIITIEDDGKTVEIDEETRLMTALKQAGYDIQSSCGGKASCCDCLVKIPRGGENLVPPEFKEKSFLGNVFHITKERLSCQTFVKGNITVLISKKTSENKFSLSKKTLKSEKE